MEHIYEIDLLLFDRSFSGFLCHSMSEEDAVELHGLEDQIDILTRQSEDNHIARLREKQCSTGPGIIFAEALHDYERIGDHANDIVHIARKTAEASGGMRPPVLSTDMV